MRPPAPPLDTTIAGGGAALAPADDRAAPRFSPWEFVPLACQALYARPGDDHLRLLLVECLLALRLRTAAIEQVVALTAPLHANARFVEIVRRINALSDDRVSPAALEATCRANLDALANRTMHAVDLRAHLDAWRARAATFEWFRAANGNIVRRTRSADGRIAWIHLGDARAGANSYHDEPVGNPEHVRPPASPIVIEGLDPPWLFQRVCAEHPRRADGYWAPVTLVQADELEFLDGLAQFDLSHELSQDRVRVYVGPDAGRRFAADLVRPERLDCVVTGPVLTTRGLRAAVSPAPGAAIETAANAQPAALDAHRAAIERRSHARAGSHCADRLVRSQHAASTLRILIVTCRFTSFVHHSAADLAAALTALGHSVRTVIEPDEFSWLRPLATVRAIDEHDPDLVIAINYTRRDLAARIPADIPVLTWVQDAMPHLLTTDAGAAIGPLDFLVGNVYHEHVERFGYPARQLLRASMPASTGKFHQAPADPALRARFECEIAYVSHHCSPPACLHAERLALIADPRVRDALNDFFPVILREAADPLRSSLSARLTRLTAAALASANINLSHPDLSRLVHVYTFPIADRVLRHQTLEWAAVIARRRAWRLHLYGRGWSAHPTLGAFARGELAHAEELRAAYACATTSLQVTLYKPTHQRVVECLLSGGLPLIRLHADDFALMEFLAAAPAAGRGAPAACHLARSAEEGEPVWGFAADEHPDIARYAGFLRALGQPTDSLACVTLSHLERAQLLCPPDGAPDDLFRFLGDPARIGFTSAAQLKERLESAIDQPGWRDQARSHPAHSARSRLTYDAFARRALDFIAQRLREYASASSSHIVTRPIPRGSAALPRQARGAPTRRSAPRAAPGAQPTARFSPAYLAARRGCA